MKPELEEYSILKLIKDIDNDMLICGESTREIPIVYKKEQVKACLDWVTYYSKDIERFEVEQPGLWIKFYNWFKSEKRDSVCMDRYLSNWLLKEAFSKLYKEK